MFVSVNGINLFYEQSGQGKPILLLHGNGEDHLIFDLLSKQLNRQYTVYAIDSRNHGQSTNKTEISYEIMREDIAAFIHALKLEKPILYGFSDGGIVGLLVALQYPTLLSNLIISGANLNPAGLKNRYLVFYKIAYFFSRNPNTKIMLTQPQIKEANLSKITIPSLVLAGSNDLIKPSHTKQIAKQIPQSTLLLVKGENHGSYIIHSEKLYHIIKPFLDQINQ